MHINSMKKVVKMRDGWIDTQTGKLIEPLYSEIV